MNIEHLYSKLKLEIYSFRDEKKGKLVAHGTRLYKDKDIIYFKLYNTNVITISEHKVIVDTGGWNTKTTCERINRIINHLGLSIGREKGNLIISDYHGWKTWLTNRDNFEITQSHYNANLDISLPIDRKKSNPKLKRLYKKTLERLTSSY